MASLWKYSLIVMLGYGLVTHQANEMTSSLMEVGNKTFELVKTLFLTTSLWSGFLNIMKESHLLERLSQILSPLLHFIYRDPLKKETKEYLSQNMIANLLGMGSIASLSGIKAIQSMQEDNHDKQKASFNMLTLVLLNTTGLTLLPTALIALRMSYHSRYPSDFVPFMILISTFTMILGLVIQRIIDHDK